MRPVDGCTQPRSQALRSLGALGALALGILATLPVRAADEQSPEDALAGMSLKQLSDVEVTTVSKQAEPLSHAPAAIYVITHDEIVRSGLTSLPEVLRLAPNLMVRQLTASSWAISARGFDGNQADQGFSNKILILIDGRSVYSPLYSGVYFDTQNVLLDDVDRIEVLSGPGATLWGANAVNGVINIITKPAYITQGALSEVATGNQGTFVDSRYGGNINDYADYRVYALGSYRDALQLSDGASAHDPWWNAQGGFRIDSSHGQDHWTAQGDAYRALEDQVGSLDQQLTGANVLARWTHDTAQSNLQVQAYFDQTQRNIPPTGPGFVLHTYDAEIQQSVALGSLDRLIWGAGGRLNDYDIRSSSTLLFVPSHRALTLGDFFAQDTLTLLSSLDFILGAKMEDDPYSGWAFLPDARLSWAVNSTNELWAAASQAVRAPTPFDEDVRELAGSQLFLTGNPAFRPERLDAFEIGYRGEPSERFTLSASVYYDYYSDLRNIALGPPPGYLPLYWGNAIEGHTYGLEAWADIQVTRWWRLSPGVAAIHEDLRFQPGTPQIVSIAQVSDDPSAQGSLTSSMNLTCRLSFDTSIRYVSRLPDPELPGYYEMNARLGFLISSGLELSLSGENLLHNRHLEYPAPDGEAIPRSGTLRVRWQY